MLYVCRAENIQWDTDEFDVVIPTERVVTVECETEQELEEAISDKLSEETGFCHKGFDYHVIDRLVRQNVVLSLSLSVNTKQGDPLEWDWHTLLDLGEDEEVEVHPA